MNDGKVRAMLEIPDKLFRQAKARAAERGVPLRQFITEALEEKLRPESARDARPWTQFGGQLRDLHQETLRLNQRIAEEFGQIDPEE